MADPIEFPDVEHLVVDRLINAMGVEVYTSVPNPRPARFVVVERVGGALRTMVSDAARIVTTCWGENDQDACTMARDARTHIIAMRGESFEGGQVYRVADLSGPSRDPDPDTGASRYSTTQSVAVRGSTLTGS